MKKQFTLARIKFRKTVRNPVVVYKALAKTTVFSVVSGEINDVAINHVAISINEVIHNIQDTLILNAISSCLKVFIDVN
jgi:hypothetical protein